jgi:hypothetical protein
MIKRSYAPFRFTPFVLTSILCGVIWSPRTHASQEILTLSDLPNCDPETPDMDCLSKLFVPLGKLDAPFDTERISAAFGFNGFYVAPEWRLTNLHVVEATASLPFACFFPEFRFAEGHEPLRGPGCGEFLFAGGHPLAPACRQSSTFMATCVDRVPIAEAFDIILQRAARSRAYLETSASPPVVGRNVYLVSQPYFDWLNEQDRATLSLRGPLVSFGRVEYVEGRGMAVSNLGFAGSSGGALLNERGEVLGILYSVVHDLRAQGVPLPKKLDDHYGIAVVLNAKMKAIIARQTGGANQLRFISNSSH